MRCSIVVVLFTLVLVVLIPSNVFADVTLPSGDKVPTGSFYFSGHSEMTSGTGVKNATLFDSILKGKETSVLEEMADMAEKGYKDNSITGDLETSTGQSLWDYDLGSLFSNTEPTSIKMRQGSTVYSIFIPRGVAETRTSGGDIVVREVNQQEITNTITAINLYKDVIKEAVIAGSVAGSFNIFSMYPNKQVPVTDILEPARSSSGAPLGYNAVKSVGISMNYTLDYLYNPLAGKMDASIITDESFKWTTLHDKLVITSGTTERVNIEIDDSFLKFISDGSDDRETLTVIDNVTIEGTGALDTTRWTAPKTGKKVEPQSFVDVSMRLMVPYLFEKGVDSSNNRYTIKEGRGYKLFGDTKLLISHSYVYGKDGDNYKRLGDYATYGIDDKSLVLYKVTINDQGEISYTGRTVGAVIPLWYKEAVIEAKATEADTEKKAGKLFLTGRTVKFGNDYSGKTELNATNSDIFAVDTKTSGKLAVPIRDFAFTDKTDFKVRDHHQALTPNTQSFIIHIDFVSSESGQNGFVMYRNNWYIDDPTLIKWLESDEARAMTEVEAGELYKAITGSFGLTKEELTYEDWVRLKEIRDEMEISFKSKMFSAIRILTMVFGVLLTTYSILLIFIFWVDILNIFIDFSILNFMTFGRLHPIASREDIGYLSQSHGNVKYVTFVNTLVISLCGVALGVVFIFSTPIVEFLLYLYYKITSWTGGV